uniref:Uncharacterized protein n=1 Tax=Panagrolaimus sp. JU765 TaxID=591449 RepID=A0AC34RLC2_9BILA
MPQKQFHHSVKLEGNRPELDDPGGGNVDDDEYDKDKISLRVNPLLRHRRQSFQKSDHQMCHVWTRNSPKDLCNKGRWQRLRALRELSVFSRDCSDETTNVQLGELFRLKWSKIKSESDLLSHTEHLKSGINGRDCLTSTAKSEQCLACFNKIDKSFQIMDKAYDAFNKTLRRFDCMLAVDISSATRPFSPNGTCEDCKKWYRKWLLVQLLDLWIEPPCINWCYYAQLACPHLAPSRQVDYAGHPSFLCRDRKMSYTGEELQSSCTCFHPCDIQRSPPEPSGWWEKNKDRPSIKHGYDFFASSEHCWSRKRRCEQEKLLKEMAIDSNRLPRIWKKI